MMLIPKILIFFSFSKKKESSYGLTLADLKLEAAEAIHKLHLGYRSDVVANSNLHLGYRSDVVANNNLLDLR